MSCQGVYFILNEWIKFFILYVLKIVSFDHTTTVLNVLFKSEIDGLFVLVLVVRPRLSSEWVQDTIVGILVNFETSLCVFVSAV